MARHYSTRDFFRQMPNGLLARYFHARDVFDTLDFTSMKETQPDELFEAWLGLPDSQRHEMATLNKLTMPYMGHSVGRWEGDTLVVEVTDFNGRNWFDRAGNFHSEALRLEERFTPITPDAIQYEVTIEDPNVFTRPWRISMPLYRRLEPNMQMLEYRCIEFAEEFLYGHLRKEPLVTRWEGETMIVDITRKIPEGDALYDWYRK